VRVQEKAVEAKLGQFTANKMGKGQFLRGNQRNLAGEGVVRKILSLKKSTSVGRNMGKGECCSGFGLPVHFLIVKHDGAY